MSTGEQFLKRLVEDVPSLEPLYREHRTDHPQILTHLLMADFTREILRLASLADGGSAGAEERLVKILGHLEGGMASGNEEIEDIVALSFLENLERDDPAATAVERRLGPALARQLREMTQE
jgi:hypothetical protein